MKSFDGYKRTVHSVADTSFPGVKIHVTRSMCLGAPARLSIRAFRRGFNAELKGSTTIAIATLTSPEMGTPLEVS